MAQYRHDRDPANVHARAAGARPLRGRPGRGRDDDAARGPGDAVPAVQPRLDDGGAGNPPNPAGHRTAYLWERGLAARRLARPARAASSTSRRRRRGRRRERRADDGRSSRASTSGTRCASSRRDAREHGAGQNYLVAALGRLGQVEHDRLARAPALDAARRRRREGVRQGRRDHRPGRARPAAPGDRSTSSSTRTASSRGSTRTRASSPRRWPASRRGSSSPRSRSSRSSSTRSASCRQRRYAVIVDEAHSSQTGEAAKDLKARPRRGEPERRAARGRGRRAAAEAATRRRRGLPRAARRRRAGGSRTCRFFAFTATPKAQDAGAVRHAASPATATLRAVPPLLDAPGDRGGLHPRRARELHDLRDLLPDREGDRGRPRVRHGEGASARSPGS